jgi:hypothetical protein
MDEITVVGGGLGGLVAAITAAEHGEKVRLLEAQRRLGGRARSTKPPYIANFGPHVIYSDGPWWTWLAERGLIPPHAGFKTGGLRFRSEGEIRAAPPPSIVKAWLRLGKETPPTEVSFRDWVASIDGDREAEVLSAAAGVFTFHHDPGRLSAAFVWPRLHRVIAAGRGVKYVEGGWTALVSPLEAHARGLGVDIWTSCPVRELPEPPVVVATHLRAARTILGDETLRCESARSALLDVAVEARRGDPFIVWDLDAPGWIERYTRPDPSLAPAGVSLLQAQTGLRPDEDLDAGIGRLEQLMDAAYQGWRERTVWKRRNLNDGETGALDLPGTSWRDRPNIDRGGGVFVVGDQVAAPGMLSEVAFHAAIEAGSRASAWRREAFTSTPSARSGKAR